MTLLLHKCKADPAFVKGLIESLQRNYNWPHDDLVPLNTDAGSHEARGTCPYCDTKLEEMTKAGGREASLLKMAPRKWTR